MIRTHQPVSPRGHHVGRNNGSPNGSASPPGHPDRIQSLRESAEGAAEGLQVAQDALLQEYLRLICCREIAGNPEKIREE